MAPKNKKRSLRKRAFLKSSKTKQVNSSTAKEVNQIVDTENELTNSLPNTHKFYEIPLKIEKSNRFLKSSKTKQVNSSTAKEVNQIVDTENELTNSLPNTHKFYEIPLKIEKSNRSRIDILGDVLLLLKSDDSKNEFKSALQSIFKLLEIEDSRKRGTHWILTTFINNVKDLNETRDLTSVAEKCYDFLFPKQLLNILTTKNDSIKEGFQIGEGGFGIVTKGFFRYNNGSEIVVAIKSPIYFIYKVGILREAIILSQLDHPNIVKLIAFQKDPTKLVMEFLENQSLDDVLVQPSDHKKYFYAWIIEILSAMEYISDRQIVHRDLATKNIFVNSKMSCKVGDFGISCFVGYNNGVYEEKMGRFQNYNVSPESRITQHYTIKSDVWAMGLLIWEMYFLEWTKRMFYGTDLLFLFRLECPPNCLKELYNYIIQDISNNDPHSRPTFTEIKDFFVQLHAKSVFRVLSTVREI